MARWPGDATDWRGVFALAGQTAEAHPVTTRHHWMRVVEPLLGTRVEVEATSRDAGIATAVEDAVLLETQRLERVFSIFDPNSEMWALRRSGHTDDEELQSVVALALQWRDRTGGAFHPAVQPLVDIWNTAESSGLVPSAADLAESAFELETPSLAHLDLNAVAKGWIAERAVDVAIETYRSFDPQHDSVWLSIGGDLVHRGAGSIAVGIEAPHRPYDNVAPLATVEIGNEALATSGSARRWWTIGGQRYSKVLDPRSGRPVEGIVSATVIASDAATADVLATTALVLEPLESIELVRSEDASCMLVRSDGSAVVSSERFRRG